MQGRERCRFAFRWKRIFFFNIVGGGITISGGIWSRVTAAAYEHTFSNSIEDTNIPRTLETEDIPRALSTSPGLPLPLQQCRSRGILIQKLR